MIFTKRWLQSLEMPVNQLDMPLQDQKKWKMLTSDFWKSLSWDLSNFEFLNQLIETGKPVYVSTGLSSTEQIVSTAKRISGLEFIHTQLDDKIEGVNLRAIDTIKRVQQAGLADLDYIAPIGSFIFSSVFFSFKSFFLCEG